MLALADSRLKYDMKIRLATERDLPQAAVLWHARMALLQQSDAYFALRPDAEREWRRRAAGWLADARAAMFAAEDEAGLRGYVVVATADNLPGLQPPLLGRISDMALDLHQAHPGLAGRLLARAQGWLQERGIERLLVDVPARYPLEEAFWRGQGAQPCLSGYWLRL